MATQYAFGKIVTDGLMSALDATDRNSYPGSGTNWFDISGNGNSATLTNTTFDTTYGGGIVFGQNKYGTHNITSAPYAGNFTWNCVFKNTNNYNFGAWDFLYTMNGFSNGLTFTTFSSKPRINYGTWFTEGITTTSSPSLTLNNYYMLTCGRSGNTIFCYLNGLPYGTWLTTSATPTITTPFIGTTPNANRSAEYWIGIINVIQVYNRTLSASEILQNYNAIKTKFNLLQI
jgi:hypothetical protein